MTRLIKFWQRFVSPLYSWANCCKYQPSCSQYAIDSIEKHGVLKGSFNGAYRILRCNPFCKGGHDPA